tara:strand:- start:1196 stop:1462 length:267 start_codon:yes stop_codon:yes gene_type:complete
MKITRKQLRQIVKEEIDAQMPESEPDLDLSLPRRGEDPDWDELSIELTRKLERQQGLKPSVKNAMLGIAYHAYKAGSGYPGLYAKGKL